MSNLEEFKQLSPDDYTVSRSVSFTINLLIRVDEFCRAKNVDRSNVVRVALERFLEQETK